MRQTPEKVRVLRIAIDPTEISFYDSYNHELGAVLCATGPVFSERLSDRNQACGIAVASQQGDRIFDRGLLHVVGRLANVQ